MRFYRLLLSVAVLLLLAGADISVFSQLPATDDLPSVPVSAHPSALHVLSNTDRELYLDAFDLDREKRFGEADAALAKVGNPLLVGTLLAKRYLSPDYTPSDAELTAWLAHYGNYPQAGEIAARKSKPEAITEAAQCRPLKGYANDGGKSILHTLEHWTAGLASYRKSDWAAAAGHFSALADADSALPAGDRAAVAFWAYRALLAAGNETDAMRYAAKAAAQPPGFYSLMARRVTGASAEATENEATKLAEVEPLLGKEAIRRAIALKEVAQDSLAETELRALFAASEEPDRQRLITLSSLLNLPAAKMSMSLEYARAGTQDSASGAFPMPHWQPVSGYHIEPALLFAIMRQESGFNPAARSAMGATGVMQLMPATANAMAHALRAPRGKAPAISMMLGQGYLQQLMDNASIGDNLVLLVAAYNAGPGNVENWKRTLHYSGDPLLFVESIPYGETRDYLLHVMGSYWIYSQLLGVEEASGLAALAQGNWPHYEGGTGQLASMVNRLGTN